MIIAKYKFTTGVDTIPNFNSGYTYDITDIDNGDGTTTREIYGKSSPTTMKFNARKGLLEIHKLDVSSITDMSYMFADCSNLVSVDGSSFDTSKVTNMASMFRSCSALKELNLTGFNTSQVNTMGDMFNSCKSLEYLDLSSFNTEKVTNMAFMFAICTSLKELDLSHFNTEKVTSMASMFKTCGSLTKLNLDGWNVENVQNMSSMFHDCTSFQSLDLSSFNASTVTSITAMFRNCNKLKELNIINFNANKASNMLDIFNSCRSLVHLDLSGFNTDSMENMGFAFTGCSSLKELDLSHFNTEKVTSTSNMFQNCSSLTKLNLDGWKTENIQNMSNMFYNCSSLQSLDLSSFNTSKVTDMRTMFRNCKSLTFLDVSSFTGENLTNMTEIFHSCSALKDLVLSNLNTDKVTNIAGAFYECLELVSLDISKLSMISATSYNNLFYKNNKLKKIKLLNNETSTIENIINLLPTKNADNKGYLFVRQEYENSKYWDNIVCEEDIQSILIPRQLCKVDDVSDVLYWDDDKKHYCIEQNIDDDYTVLSEPVIIDLPHLNQKYFLDTYLPSTGLSCSNSPVQPSRIFAETDKIKYKPKTLVANKGYTIQFNCNEKSSANIKFNLDGAEVEIDANIGVNQLFIKSPTELSAYMLNVSGEGDRISDVMLIEGEIIQTPNYFEDIQSTGELQEDETYKITIRSNNEIDSHEVTIFSNQPLVKGDSLYWNKSNKRYEIDRNGDIEIPVVEGDIIDLPRLYQKVDTNIRVETGNINPSEIEIEYIDIN